MKTIIITIALLFSVFISNAQEKQKKEIKTVSFKVEGNCEECKKRIENASFIKGVKNSTWDQKTKQLTVTYRADKIVEDLIHEAIAKSGHETEKIKAPNEAYQSLPKCCKYKDNKCEK